MPGAVGRWSQSPWLIRPLPHRSSTCSPVGAIRPHPPKSSVANASKHVCANPNQEPSLDRSEDCRLSCCRCGVKTVDCGAWRFELHGTYRTLAGICPAAISKNSTNSDSRRNRLARGSSVVGALVEVARYRPRQYSSSSPPGLRFPRLRRPNCKFQRSGGSGSTKHCPNKIPTRLPNRDSHRRASSYLHHPTRALLRNRPSGFTCRNVHRGQCLTALQSLLLTISGFHMFPDRASR